MQCINTGVNLQASFLSQPILRGMSVARNHHELAVMNMIGHRWITHRQQITHQILQLGQSLLVARSQPGLVAAIFGTLGKVKSRVRRFGFELPKGDLGATPGLQGPDSWGQLGNLHSVAGAGHGNGHGAEL